jgi:MazG family protein
MSLAPNPAGSSFTRLVEIMDRLLAPDGCPWDRDQTLASLRPFLIEETYEVLDALDRDDVPGHCEELGDLLMQVVFQAALRRAAGGFAIDDVVASICDKLVRRHPHVFADAQASDAKQVLAQWERIKDGEKAGKAAGPVRTLGDVPRGLPALARAQKLGSRAGRVGFDWPGATGSLGKVREEIEEVVETIKPDGIGAQDQAAAHHEIGDLLFAVVNLARKLDVDAEVALGDASRRFTARFEYIEDRLAEDGRGPRDSNLDEMDALWNQAKRALAPADAAR